MNIEFAKHLVELKNQTEGEMLENNLEEFKSSAKNLFDGFPTDSLFYSGFVQGMAGSQGILEAFVNKGVISREGADEFINVAIMIIGQAAELYIESVNKEDKEKFLLD